MGYQFGPLDVYVYNLRIDVYVLEGLIRDRIRHGFRNLTPTIIDVQNKISERATVETIDRRQYAFLQITLPRKLNQYSGAAQWIVFQVFTDPVSPNTPFSNDESTTSL